MSNGCLRAVLLLLAPALPAAAQMPPARVVVAPVEQREVAAGQTFVGTVVPLRASTVGSTVEGRLVERLASEGDAVRGGEPLARLRTEPLEIDLAAANAELALRQEQLAELENGTRPEEIEQAKARMLAAKALTDFAQLHLKRTQSLYERKATSVDDLQEATSTAAAAEQGYFETKAAWEMAVAGPRREQIDQARSRVEFQQEIIRRLKDDIAEHTIAAPFDGYVTKEHTEIGQWVAKGAAVFDVVEIHEVEIEAAVPESYVSHLKAGDAARVELAALPGRSWTAPLAAVVPQADVRSRSFPVKVRLTNEIGPGGAVFRPGMFARITLPVGETKNALLVPKDAVVLGGPWPVVFAMDPVPTNSPPANASSPSGPAPAGPPPDAVARQVPVELGAAVGDLVEVRGPLRPGDRVAVEGNERLFPGAPVVITNKEKPAGR